MALDAANDVYVVGETTSSNFPLASPIQSTYGGGTHDATITEVNSTGSSFVFSSYLGGTGEDVGRSVALDLSANIYITGRTGSPNFPVTPGIFQPICGTDGTCNGGVLDAFAVKISPSADLSITNVAPGHVNSGATLTYRITLSNTAGPDQALNAQISDVIPVGTTYNSVTVPAGTTCSHPSGGGTGTVLCTVAVLPKSGSVIETLVVNVTAGSGSTIQDRANIIWGGSDPNQANNSATARTQVN